VWKRFGELVAEAVEKGGGPPGRVLDIGGRISPDSLLTLPELEKSERVCVNLESIKDDLGITAVQANGNDLPMFPDGHFDWVFSNATFEHDPTFWLTLAEMRRVLKPGGLMMIGVPGFDKTVYDGQDAPPDATLTYRYHMVSDFYRFSPRAVRKVFFEGFNRVRVEAVLNPPRLIGRGRKPKNVDRIDAPTDAARPIKEQRAEPRKASATTA
jgi:SAM-dependent methyltransferase